MKVVSSPLLLCLYLLASLPNLGRSNPDSKSGKGGRKKGKKKGRPYDTIYAEIEALKQDISNLQADFEDFQAETEDFSAQLGNLTLVVEANAHSIEDLEVHIAEVEALVAANTGAMEGLDILTSELRDEMTAADAGYDQLLGYFYGNVTLIEGHIANFTSEVSRLNEEMITESELPALVSNLVKIQTLEQNIQVFMSAKETLEVDIADLQVAISDLGIRVSGLETDVASLQDTTSRLQQDVATLKGSVASISSNVDVLEGKITAVEEQVVANTGAIQNLDSLTSDLRTDLDTSNADYKTLHGYFKGNVTLIGGQIAHLSTQVNGIKQEMVGKTDLHVLVAGLVQIQTLEADIQLLQQEQTNLQANMQTLESRMTTIEGRISALENSVSLLQQDLQTLMETVDTITMELDGLELQVADAVTMAGDNGSAIAALLQEIVRVNQGLSGLSDSFDSYQTGAAAEIHRLANRIDNLSTTVNDNQASLGSRVEALSVIQTIRSQIAALNTADATMRSSIDSAHSRLSALEGQVTGLISDITSIETTISEQQSGLTALAADLDALSLDFETFELQVEANITDLSEAQDMEVARIDALLAALAQSLNDGSSPPDLQELNAKITFIENSYVQLTSLESRLQSLQTIQVLENKVKYLLNQRNDMNIRINTIRSRLNNNYSRKLCNRGLGVKEFTPTVIPEGEFAEFLYYSIGNLSPAVGSFVNIELHARGDLNNERWKLEAGGHNDLFSPFPNFITYQIIGFSATRGDCAPNFGVATFSVETATFNNWRDSDGRVYFRVQPGANIDNCYNNAVSIRIVYTTNIGNCFNEPVIF